MENLQKTEPKLTRITSTPKITDSSIKFLTQVYQTTKYSLFRYLEGNRALDRVNLKRVKDSIEQEYLINPIIINEKFEIIEGQHRFEAAKELGLPIYFIQVDGYGLKQTHRLNTISKKWDYLEFAYSYANLGNENYKLFLEFKNKYKFDVRGVIGILGEKSSGGQYGKHIEKFARGEFIVGDVERAHELANNILDFKNKDYYAGYTKRSFILATIKLMKHPAYSHDHMLKQLEKRAFPIYDFPNSGLYLETLTKIYNYGKHGEKIKF